MNPESRRKGPRSPSVDSDDSSHRRRARKYDRDRSISPRRSWYRCSRSRDRRSNSRERRRKDCTNRSQDWNQSNSQNPPQSTAPNVPTSGYIQPVYNQYQAPPPPNTSQPPPPLPAYNQGYNNYNYTYNQGYDYTYQPTNYCSDYPPPNWQAGQVPYNNQPTQAPPAIFAAPEPTRAIDSVSSDLNVIPRQEDVKKEAIAAEDKQKKATLAKEREEYVKTLTTLEIELDSLRHQCDEIRKEGGRDNNRIVKENQKLQVAIQNKMKSMHNDINILTRMIGDKVTVEDLKSKFKLELPLKRSRSPKKELAKVKVIESPGRSMDSDMEKDSKDDRDRKLAKVVEEDSKPMYNFVHYDPEMHWCKVCNIFPKTAKEYLNHLHSNEHKETCLEGKIVIMPWHQRNRDGMEKEVPYYSGLPTKRTPIKGLQFFIAATAWYCELCDSWIGDLHCASFHLKSKRHSENFSRFVEQNPHWETDWMADREKAFSDERQKQVHLELQKQKDDDLPAKSKKSKKSKKNKKKSKKRKNRSSNSDSSSESDNSDSDSDQDMSKSIRVAMRNKMKSSTQAILKEEIDYHGIKLKSPWSHVAPVNKLVMPEDLSHESNDHEILNSIRDKMKVKQEDEREEAHRQNSDTIQPDEDENSKCFTNKIDSTLEVWGPKEPPKSFWIKKDEERPQQLAHNPVDIPKPEDMPKPHMGFWTKQQVNMSMKPNEKPMDKEEDRERERERDRHRDDRDRKYDRRDDKYHSRYDNYDRRRRGGSGGGRDRDRDRERDRDRDRDRDYYDDRRKDRRGDDSPRRDRNWRDGSPKRGYDKYKDRRDDESNDESKFEKKANESASKSKKGQAPMKKQTPQSNKGKLPFIGRLPLFKKKNEEPKTSEKDITPLPYAQSKFEDTPKVPSEIINPPGVVHITKLATPLNLNNSIPLKTQTPMKILVAPPPPVLNVTKLATAIPQQVIDMEIEDQLEETIIEQTSIVEDNLTSSEITISPTAMDTVGNATTDHSLPDLARPPPSMVATAQSTTVMDTSSDFNANKPPPYIATGTPPFVENATRFNVRPPAVAIPAFGHPPPMQNAFVQAQTGATAMMPMEAPVVPIESADVQETDKRTADPSTPLPEDLQEALNIIFPKDEVEPKKEIHMDNNIMYATMYSSMLGCVGYGPEYMDQPPPEITQAETDIDTQPGPDDLKMLGIDESDTIF